MIKLHENFQKLLEFSSPSAIIVHIQWKYSSAGMSVRLTRERSWVRAPLLPRKTTQDMRRVLRSAWFLLFFLFLRIIQINPLQIVLLADDPALVRHGHEHTVQRKVRPHLSSPYFRHAGQCAPDIIVYYLYYNIFSIYLYLHLHYNENRPGVQGPLFSVFSHFI